MIPTDTAIYRVRRDITLGMLLKWALVAAVVISIAFAPQTARFAIVTAIVGLWIGLTITSARSSMLANASPSLIAAGEFEEAEKQIDLAMRAFSVFAGSKLRALQQLAVLRHAQGRWKESAALCRAILRQRLGRGGSLARPTTLILTESLLELDDAPGAYWTLAGLYAQPLSLDDTLSVLCLQLHYEAKIGAWAKMFSGARTKVLLAELMPTRRSAQTQAMLALAAQKCGRGDWADWLRRRAELLADANVLTTERPALAALWPRPA